jgi:hypothetical protein
MLLDGSYTETDKEANGRLPPVSDLCSDACPCALLWNTNRLPVCGGSLLVNGDLGDIGTLATGILLLLLLLL